MSKKTTAPSPAYQLKITLAETQPPIWRRVVVSPKTTLHDLHWIIQAVMPWTNSHLHAFEDREGNRYSDPHFQLEDTGDESAVTIGKLLKKPREKIVYQYDFGDDWQHLIELEKNVAPKVGQKLPLCIDGERAGPPDDCGGVWGYVDMLVALKDSRHSAHREMVEWAGEEFDPEVFDIEEANESLMK